MSLEYGTLLPLEPKAQVPNVDSVHKHLKAALGLYFERVAIVEKRFIGIDLVEGLKITHDFVVRADKLRDPGQGIGAHETAFNAAWGGWQEYRQFQDNIKTYAVVLSEQPSVLATKDVVPVLLAHLLSTGGVNVRLPSPPAHGLSHPRVLPTIPARDAPREVHAMLNDIKTRLREGFERRAARGLGAGVDVAALTPLSAVARGAAVTSYARWDAAKQRLPSTPIPVLVQLNAKASGWTGNLLALSAIRTSVLGAMAKMLDRSHTAVLHRNYLLLHREGQPVFCLSLAIPRETSLLRAADESALRADQLDYTMTDLPRLLFGLYSAAPLANSTFRDTCRLAKRWLATHGVLLTPVIAPPGLPALGRPVPSVVAPPAPRRPDALTEEAVDCLVAFVFISHPMFTAAPSTPAVALARVLQLLATHDFAHSPIIVDFRFDSTEALTNDARRDMLARAPTLATALPLFTTHSTRGDELTQHVSPGLMGRVRDLARATLPVAQRLIHGDDGAALSMFKPDLTLYDAVLTLRGATRQTVPPRPAVTPVATDLPAVDLIMDGPAAFARPLSAMVELVHSQPFLASHVKLSGDAITDGWVGVRFVSDVAPVRNTKLYGSRMVEGGTGLQVDPLALLDDMCRVGEGLVVDVAINPTEAMKVLASRDTQLSKALGLAGQATKVGKTKRPAKNGAKRARK